MGHLEAKTIVQQLEKTNPDEFGVKTVKFVVEKNQSAYNPASTSRFIYGPNIVTYRMFIDGAINATLEPYPNKKGR